MSKNKTARIVVGVVCAIVIVIGVAFAISYGVWAARGDVVTFSGTGNLGLGNDPIVETNNQGKHIQIGTYHNFLFVRDQFIDRKTFGQFTGGGMPGRGGGGGGGRAPAGGRG